VLTPMITKRYNKRNIYVWGRVIQTIFVFAFFGLFKLNMMWIYVIFSFLTSIFSGLVGSIGGGLNADALDYYQWKNGERCDSISGVFGWFTSPLGMMIAFAIPLVYQRAGYTSDWGVLYDTAVFNQLFTWSFYITFIGTVLSVIPYFFYDLTTDKHRKCVQEIRERTVRADTAEIEKHREAGTIHLISPELLTRYGFDPKGNPIEETAGEVLTK